MAWSSIISSAIIFSHMKSREASMASQSQAPLPLLFYLCIATPLVFVAYAGNLHLAFPPHPNITFYKDAYPEWSVIQLTKNKANDNLQSSYGCVTFNEAIPLWDNSSQALANFTTHFQFRITVISSKPPGDGLTFFLAPPHFEPPVNAMGEGFGLFNRTTNGDSSNQVVAVEFDTFRNLFDPDDNHVGVDVNSIISNKTASLNASDGLQNETLKNGEYWKAWVDYNGGNQMLDVFLLSNPSGDETNISKPERPILSYNIDLRKFLPPNIQVGLSASTGLYLETHEVFSWNFSSEYSWKTETPAPRKGTSVKVIVISVCVVVPCAFLFVGGWWYFKCRGEASNESDMELDEWFAQGPRKFSYTEVSAATRNFSDDQKLGEGGFGGVYRGILPGTDEAVAVKRISHGSKQGRKEYISEVTIISKLRHRNLVQLLGWCHEKGELLLVYELLPNGSLDKYLFGKQNGGLDWERRYNIACDVASALVYLHDDWDQRVVHRDVKASNIMLDSNFNAKLGDFGLARVMKRDHEASHTTVVAGTFGYLAPECVVTGKSSPEFDVFSFGAVSLEIACGKRPVERSLSEHNFRLVEWVWDLHGQGKILDAADERLGENFKLKEMERLMAVGLLCSHPDPKARPTMRDVVKILKFEAGLPYIPPNLPVPVYPNAHRSDGMSSSTGTSMTMNSSNMVGLSESSSSSAVNSSFSSGPFKPLLYNTEVHPSSSIG